MFTVQNENELRIKLEPDAETALSFVHLLEFTSHFNVYKAGIPAGNCQCSNAAFSFTVTFASSRYARNLTNQRRK